MLQPDHLSGDPTISILPSPKHPTTPKSMKHQCIQDLSTRSYQADELVLSQCDSQVSIQSGILNITLTPLPDVGPCITDTEVENYEQVKQVSKVLHSEESSKDQTQCINQKPLEAPQSLPDLIQCRESLQEHESQQFPKSSEDYQLPEYLGSSQEYDIQQSDNTAEDHDLPQSRESSLLHSEPDENESLEYHTLLQDKEPPKDMNIIEDENPFESDLIALHQDNIPADDSYTPKIVSLLSSEITKYDNKTGSWGSEQDDGLSTEERYELLNKLLIRSSTFTDVVGGQVRKQQEKRKKKREAKERSKPLKNLILTDISPHMNNIKDKRIPQESVEELGLDVTSETAGKNRKRHSKHSEILQNPKRFKPVNVRYYNNEVIPYMQPNLLTGAVLRNYQVDGYDWLRILYENGINGILADEMGLGKTIQTIALICYLIEKEIEGPFLVVAPMSTLHNWQREFARFSPTIYTLLYHGDRLKRHTLLDVIKRKRRPDPEVQYQSNKRPVVITHYDLIRHDFKKLVPVQWTYMVLDEGHKIKNSMSRTSRDLSSFRCDSRLILTGTPIQNNLTELWSLMNFLMPAIFDDKHTFQHWFDVLGNLREEVIDRERQKPIIGIFQKIIRPFIMRRLKCDVQLNLPPKKEILVYCPLTRVQKDFYKALLDRTIMSVIRKEYEISEELELEEENGKKRLRRSCRLVDYKEMRDRDFMKVVNGVENVPLSWTGELNYKYEEPDTLPVFIEVSSRMTHVHLRKVVNHPYLIAHPYDQFEKGKALIISEDVVQLSGKMRILDTMLKNLIQKGHKMLIYSQWVRILDLIQDLMELRDIKFVRLQGSHQLAAREESINQFQTDEEIKCFLITTRAGGLGINLTAADTVIIFDSDWNPHVDTQAQDRCHRIGQTRPVIVYRLVAAHTIDQKLVERAFTKKKLDKILINNKDFCKNSWTQNKITTIPIEELQELLTELEYDKRIGEGEDFTEEQMRTLLDRPNLIEGVANEAFRVVSAETIT
ncbi:Lymphoid-specific helicase [Oopsacas minuta]|uniref:Lymphoid-specific helicase n=1 Tax=Oopsacas minuta TaxID=111878 RepID=A0AAV7K1C1_9METZ|nr:Lymphoid-specific helicase [Oopsacas minuta]